MSVALADVPDRLSHALWSATVGQELQVTHAETGMWLDFGGLRPEWREPIKQTMELYAWSEAGALVRARARFPGRAARDDEGLRRRRLWLAEDLVEGARAAHRCGRPVRARRPAGRVRDLLVGAPAHRRPGALCPRRGEAARADPDRAVGRPLRIHLDGHLSGFVTWWEEGGDPGWEVALLEAVHAPLVEAWVARLPAPAPLEEPVGAQEAVATMADANLRIAEPVEGRALPSVRMDTLLGLLERRFGCESAPERAAR